MLNTVLSPVSVKDVLYVSKKNILSTFPTNQFICQGERLLELTARQLGQP